MVETRNSSKSNGAAAGEKHTTDTKAASANKRQKAEKQTTLDDAVIKKDRDGDGDEDGNDETKEENEEPESGTDQKETPAPTSGDGSGGAVRPSEEEDMPSSILEKGVIYFFLRGRVNIDEPSGVKDVARSHIVLRPFPRDAKLGEGTLGDDAANARLLALPKKVLPQSGKDRFMAFVEKPSATLDELKETFLASDDYETKTAGSRHKPAPAPFGEGVYAITTTGRESHLAYMLTLPEEPGDLQKEMGLKEKGSFIISSRNPNTEPPKYAQLPEGPEYPKEIMDEFGSLRWLPSKPEHFDHANAQILLIGESSGLDKALEPAKEDKEEGKEEPREALEHLEEEDIKRMRHLPGDQSASVFADLEIHAKDYPKLKTSFK